MDNEEIIFHPIGYVNSPYEKLDDMPKSYQESGDTIASITIKDEYVEAMCDMKKDEEYLVLFNFHESDGYDLKVPLRGCGPITGLFSTHAPRRPNPIGASIIKIVDINDNVIFFKGVDMLNSTPVLDIKSYKRKP